MLERNKRLVEELHKLQEGRFKGQITLHIVDGIAKLMDFPRKAHRKELYDNGKEEKVQEVKNTQKED